MFSLPLKCSEGNSESSRLFLFNGTEFRVVFSFAEGFGTEFRGFLFGGTAGIPSEITICSVYSVFRGIIFLSVIPNPSNARSMAQHCGLTCPACRLTCLTPWQMSLLYTQVQVQRSTGGSYVEKPAKAQASLLAIWSEGPTPCP